MRKDITMKKVRRRLFAYITLLAVLALPQAAFAAPGDQGITGAADKVRALLTEWGGALALGVAAVMAVVAIYTRKMNELVMVFVALIAIGGLVFAQGTLTTLIKDFWGLLG
jgi:TrbC/VIRB2 pilin